MVPSEVLRKEIEKKYNIDLEQYAWSEETCHQIFSIELDKFLETTADTLEEIYIKGFNIGHCGLTSRYIARNFNNVALYYGKAELLKGTKNAPNGEHAWTIIDEFLIDTTLMLCIPKSKVSELGYIPEKIIAPASATILSEYDVYENEYKNEVSQVKQK